MRTGWAAVLSVLQKFPGTGMNLKAEEGANESPASTGTSNDQSPDWMIKSRCGVV